MEVQIYPIDIVFAIVVAAAAVRGIFRGFVAELLSMSAFVLGLAGAIVFYRTLAEYLGEMWKDTVWNYIVSFLALFVCIYLAVKLVEGLLHKIFHSLRLEKLDKVLGFLLGIVEGIIFIAIMLFILTWQPIFDPAPLLERSAAAQFLLPFLPSPDEIPIPKINLNDV